MQATAPFPRRPSETPLGDLIAGRWLAWIGGIATLTGLLLFLALAISHGWLGRTERVLLAGAASAGLMAGGAWLHRRRGRTEAAVVMVGAGTAGLFATLVVAGEVYKLIPPLLAVTASMAVGIAATAFAVRWAGQAIAALGLVGALLSPVLTGGPIDGASIAILTVASACSMSIVIWRRWTWLAFVAPLISTPQWTGWMLQGHNALIDGLVLAGFAMPGLLAALGSQRRASSDKVVPFSAGLLALNACIAAAVGEYVLRVKGAPVAAEMWLGCLAAAHLLPGLISVPRLRLARATRLLLLVIALILADATFALVVSGLALEIGWGVTAIGFAWLLRRTGRGSTDELLAGLGVGAHVALVLLRTALALPLEGDLGQLLTVATLAGTCLTSAQLAGSGRRYLQAALNLLGLAATAYLTAGMLDGAPLDAAWAAEALALMTVYHRTGDRLAALAAGGFLGGAVMHALAFEAPPTALVIGVPGLGAAAIALGAIVFALARAAQLMTSAGRERQVLWGGAALASLYLASVTIVTIFQPANGTGLEDVLDLGVRQQGQVLLSTFWSVIGLAGLVAGARLRRLGVRNAALALLLVTVAKVFVYDLSTLTSIYRVISFIALGLLLLAGAFAHARLRAPQP